MAELLLGPLPYRLNSGTVIGVPTISAYGRQSFFLDDRRDEWIDKGAIITGE
jgi:hypothetical protein